MNHDHPDGAGAPFPEHPVDALVHEHRTIQQVLGALEVQARALEDGAPPQPSFWRDALDFVATYADRCHHGKEEALLFAELDRADAGGHGLTACMRDEHEQGRAHCRAMGAALERGDGRALAAAARQYTELLREHIDKEDQLLFPMAKAALSAEAVARLRAGFAAVEQHDLGAGVHQRYEELALRLAAAPV